MKKGNGKKYHLPYSIKAVGRLLGRISRGEGDGHFGEWNFGDRKEILRKGLGELFPSPLRLKPSVF